MPERPEDAQHETVYVKERQCMNEDVVGRPLPGLPESVEVRRDCRRRQHRALRRSGRPRREEDDGGAVIGRCFISNGCGAIPTRRRTAPRHHRCGVTRTRHDDPRQAFERSGKRSACRRGERVGPARVEDVGQLPRSERRVDRHDRRPRLPQAGDGDDGFDRRVGPQRDAAMGGARLRDRVGVRAERLARERHPFARSAGGTRAHGDRTRGGASLHARRGWPPLDPTTSTAADARGAAGRCSGTCR